MQQTFFGRARGRRAVPGAGAGLCPSESVKYSHIPPHSPLNVRHNDYPIWRQGGVHGTETRTR